MFGLWFTLQLAKKWEKNWNEVKYCSEKCRKNKSKILNKL
jgi:hypothetical protein